MSIGGGRWSPPPLGGFASSWRRAAVIATAPPRWTVGRRPIRHGLPLTRARARRRRRGGGAGAAEVRHGSWCAGQWRAPLLVLFCCRFFFAPRAHRDGHRRLVNATGTDGASSRGSLTGCPIAGVTSTAAREPHTRRGGARLPAKTTNKYGTLIDQTACSLIRHGPKSKIFHVAPVRRASERSASGGGREDPWDTAPGPRWAPPHSHATSTDGPCPPPPLAHAGRRSGAGGRPVSVSVRPRPVAGAGAT